MRYLEGKVVHVNGQAMTILHQSYSGLVTVEPLPACSLATRLMIISWLRDLGYKAK